MNRMQNLINSKYSKETKVIDAVHPRSFSDSTLVPHKDILRIVYDIYTPVLKGCSGKPRVNLLFLHGSGMNRCIWEYYVAHLLDYDLNWSINKIVLMDQVTHGDSAVLNEGKLSVNFDWVDGARDACKVAQAEFYSARPAYNVVIGHSMGGFQALSCAILVPDLFQLVLAIEPVALMFNGKGTHEEYTVIPPKFHKALLSKMKDRFECEEEYDSYMRNKSFFTKVHPEILQRIIEFERIDLSKGAIRTKMDQRQNILCYMTLYPTGKWLLNSLKFIRSPVVSLVGGISKWCPKENQQTLENLIPDYYRDVLPDGDHLLNIEKPDESIVRIICHISKFIASNSRNQTNSDEDLTVDQRSEKYAGEFNRFCSERVKDRPMALAKF